MEHALRTLRDHPKLDLSVVATGMHLSRSHGYTLREIRRQGWTVDATVPWRGDTAKATGYATAGLVRVFESLQSDIVLIVGDRVEALAAATAGHLSGRIVAHVHGGDRALGQSDDALRHAITKLAHLHFPATRQSARRIARLGEDAFRIHLAGTPGLDGLPSVKANAGEPFVLVALHPDDANVERQERQARMLTRQLLRAGVRHCVFIWPNNDPGWQGIAACWEESKNDGWTFHRSLPRHVFLQLLGQGVCLVGNSSSGILEAASLRTHVINIGDRQKGRERSKNVIDVPWQPADLRQAISAMWRGGRRSEYRGTNIYGAGDAGKVIAGVLGRTPLGDRLRKKLIFY